MVVAYGYGFGAVVVGDRGDDDGAVAAKLSRRRRTIVIIRTSIPLLDPQPLLLYILDQLLELAHAN